MVDPLIWIFLSPVNTNDGFCLTHFNILIVYVFMHQWEWTSQEVILTTALLRYMKRNFQRLLDLYGNKMSSSFISGRPS